MDDFSKRLKNKIYYLENRKSLIQKQIIYNSKNKEHIKDYQEQYRNSKLEYIRKINRDNMRTKDKTELMLKRYKNIAKKLGLKCDIDLLIWTEIMDYFDNECAVCSCENVSIGFVIPYSKNGNIVYGNIIPLCLHHHKSKKNRLIEEWLQLESFKKYHTDKAIRLMEYIRNNNKAD